MSLGQLYTDDTDDTDDDADDNANDNQTWQTKHDCIGSLPNEPKTPLSSGLRVCANNFYSKLPLFGIVKS